MLSVWCVLNGDKYQDKDAHILKGMVARNLKAQHRFRCLADREITGIDTLVPDEQWPGWWSKLLLFRYAGGQVLYLDLDTVIVGNLDRLLSDRLSMPANWGQSGHGGCQSSVMSWNSDYENLGYIADLFDIDQVQAPERGNCGAYGPKNLWGDQEYVTELMGDPGDVVKPMPHVFSYRYHALGGPPGDASIVCFHGEPKPAAVNAEWVLKARSFTATGG